MKQMTRRLTLWSACLLVLGSTPTWAQQAPSTGALFIQGSEVNLRDKPATNAKVVGKVAIATECQHVKDAPRQWVRLKCGDVEGFTLKSLVGAQKPTAEALLAQTRDTTQPAKTRLDAAMRAATLDSKNEQALKLLADLFFDVNFEQLLKDTDKGGLHESFVVKREVLEDQNRKETGEECLLRELEKIEYDWHRFQLRRNDFVSAMYRDGALVVYTGNYLSMKGRYKLEDDQDHFQVTIESRSSSAVSEALKLALSQGARPPQGGTEKYTLHYGEYPGMPILRPEAFRLLRALPPRWHLLSEEQGERFIRSTCGLVFTQVFRFDLHRRAAVERGDTGMESDDEFGESQSGRIADITRSGSTYTFRHRGYRGDEYTWTLTWPTETPGVGIWNESGPGSEGSPYAAGAARGIEVREYCSPQ
ncbi:hypothetical protein [Myxococcus sp. RHSTA-1-4]|uniref:hypothetical protein n=1 Tax=Myxococcus sp. RHSTA-1-4 TaxID=2874601 RepID=UPI001CBB00F1|nr:hypothetical protein [Myxococcus sp. RHSTA-1-4]MBZ4423177.1 hypothetical protein [Myxococcus sp. RHSTA-1-4]